MKVIVGLGNPGKKYTNTRHNVGFMFVDEIAKKLSLSFRLDKAKKAEIAESNLEGEKILLVKPQTFMNLSGDAVIAILQFYKLEVEDLLIIYDDMDLDVGRIKIKPAGSSGGHNGIDSIINRLGTSQIKRIRIGISKPASKDTIDYVLGNFGKNEKIEIDLSLDKGYDMIRDFITKGFDFVMNKYN